MHSSTGGAGELSRREKTIAASVKGGWSVAGDSAILKRFGCHTTDMDIGQCQVLSFVFLSSDDEKYGGQFTENRSLTKKQVQENKRKQSLIIAHTGKAWVKACP